jgi:hypothetical protein
MLCTPPVENVATHSAEEADIATAPHPVIVAPPSRNAIEPVIVGLVVKPGRLAELLMSREELFGIGPAAEIAVSCSEY